MIGFALLALVVLLGHLGWWVFCYNRINSTALPRKFIKRCEVGIIVIILVLPIVMTTTHWSAIVQMASGQTPLSSVPVLWAWIFWSIGSVLILGPLWLESRLWLIPPKNIVEHLEHRVDVARELQTPLTGKWISHLARRLPLNEITHLSVTRKRLVLDRAFEQPWNALKIGHMSDLHFTGQLTRDYYVYVVSQMQRMTPDMIVVTGDIIDKDFCLDWIGELLGPLQAPLGCYYLFGNHECRLSRLESAAERLDAIGWIDVGRRDVVLAASSDGDDESSTGRPDIILCGNERPWFERHEQAAHWEAGPIADPRWAHALRLGLVHTPDQHPWARELGLDLLLAGHTHGGQVRLPGIGPLISPSRYGSRFASGVFRLPPTLMHVSRGLAGTQPLRWRCPPEISLLTISPASPTIAETSPVVRAQPARTGATS